MEKKLINLTRRNVLKATGVLAGAGAISGGGTALMSGMATAGTSVIDDFEDGDLSEYVFDQGSSGASVVSSPTFNGASALEINGTDTEMISTAGLARYPTQGDTFTYRFRSDATAVANLSYGVQGHGDRYFVQLDLADQYFKLVRYENASGNQLVLASGVPFSTGVWYEVEVEWRTDGTHVATLYDESGSQIEQITATDTTWTSGGIGFDGYYGSGGSGYYDYVTLASSTTDSSIIDDFEDGDISEYTFDQGSSGAGLVSSPTYEGSYALQISDTNTEMISTSGLDTYPVAGDVFSYRFRGEAMAAVNLSYGVQDHGNRYFVQLDFPDQYFKIVRYENASGNQLVLASDVPFSTGIWYKVEVEWKSDGTHIATLYDENGSQIEQITATDTTWTSGGIGFDGYYSGGGAGYYDYVTKGRPNVLGDFEGGLDGWTTNGSNSLSQVSQTEQQAPVTREFNALDVTIDSDPEPTIENQQRIQQADLSNYPCLLADVLPASVQSSNSAVTFRFRYHHSSGVEESPEMTVDQKYGGCLAWDMSGLSATKLANSDRLEVVWYPRDHPPGSGFDYNGQVFVDNVRVTDDRNQVTQARRMRQHCEHERAHGPMTDQIIQSETDTTQDGVYEYHDGTQISYHVEKLSNGDFQETCDGETFTWEVSS